MDDVYFRSNEIWYQYNKHTADCPPHTDLVDQSIKTWNEKKVLAAIRTLKHGLWYGGNGAWRNLFMHLNGTKSSLLLRHYSNFKICIRLISLRLFPTRHYPLRLWNLETLPLKVAFDPPPLTHWYRHKITLMLSGTIICLFMFIILI